MTLSSLDARLTRLEVELARSRSELMALESRPLEGVGLPRAALVLVAALGLGAAPPTDGTRATAPFVVVDDSNRSILEVRADPADPRKPGSGPIHSLAIYRNGEPVILAVARDKSSFWKTVSEDGNTVAVIGQEDGTRPAMYLRTGGAYNNRVAVVVIDDKPAFNMSNERGKAIVNVTQGESGGGLLQLGGPDGNEIVAATIHPPGVGIVRAQPVGRAGVNVPKTGIIRGTGLPATFICGKGCIQ